jgi:hypothetical protein
MWLKYAGACSLTFPWIPFHQSDIDIGLDKGGSRRAPNFSVVACRNVTTAD